MTAGEEVTEGHRLTRGSLLAGNAVWNLVGQGAPLLVGIFTIPPLIHGLGVDRFGVLAIAWLLVGYFSLFDLGLGRAITKLVAERLALADTETLPGLVWTALALMVVLGIAGAAIVAGLAPVLAKTVLRTPRPILDETVNAFVILGLSIPFVTLTTGLRGILEAMQRFDLSSPLRLAYGILNYVAPLAVLPLSHSLVYSVGALLVSRVVILAAHWVMCLRAMPSLRHGVVRRREVKPLLSFGSWITVSNVVSPLMVYLDRFLLGSLVSVAAVAYYAAPYEAVTRLWVLPMALVGVAFPAFAAVAGDRPRVTRIYTRTLTYVFLGLFPVILGLVALAGPLLRVWLGADFAGHSAPVLELLAAGVLVNSLAQVAFGLIQAAGRPDITAKLHMVELPLYVVGLVFLIDHYGIVGAAIAWVARVTADAGLLFFFARRFVEVSRPQAERLAVAAAAAAAAVGFAALPIATTAKAAYLAVVIIALVGVGWVRILDDAEKVVVRTVLNKALLRT